MKVETSVLIEGTKERVWSVITDIEHSDETIVGIQKIEVLNKPEQGIIGLKWRETRTMFGKEATEVMWITEAKENQFYRTRAESHGAIYVSELRIKEASGGCRLTMAFEGTAVTFGAKIGNFIFAHLMKSSTKKALLEDLMDIKEVVERV